MIEIVPYQCEWSEEFEWLGRALRAALGGLAVRIDHIGSTSVPGLAAKNIIDIQVTASDLTAELDAAFMETGYNRLVDILRDHVPLGASDEPEQWAKWFYNQGGTGRRVNLHVRLQGRSNQRYALLFRDYLRAHPRAAVAYAQVKVALARSHADNVEAYSDAKDPVCDIIIAGAEGWAAATCWEPGPSDQ
jgi:GrpB-like predicted nucleotidyltransferase (UPF0157 family)